MTPRIVLASDSVELPMEIECEAGHIFSLTYHGDDMDADLPGWLVKLRRVVSEAMCCPCGAELKED